MGNLVKIINRVILRKVFGKLKENSVFKVEDEIELADIKKKSRNHSFKKRDYLTL